MKVAHYADADLLFVSTGEPDSSGSSLNGATVGDVVVFVADDEGQHVVALEIFGASWYLPLGKHGYDQHADTLTMGSIPNRPAKTTENADIIAYWMPDPDDGVLDAVAVTLRNASRHLPS